MQKIRKNSQKFAKNNEILIFFHLNNYYFTILLKFECTNIFKKENFHKTFFEIQKISNQIVKYSSLRAN